MTSPDAFFPERAYQSNTLYKMQEVTQESVALQQSEDMRAMLQELFDTFFDNLFGGFGDVVSAVVAAINSFIHDLLMLLDGFTGGLFNLDALADTFNSTHSTAVNAETTANTASTTALNAMSQATAANENASSAVDTAEAAANAAATAQETADIAYGLSSYWEAECVVASAEVLQGVNELLIGLCQNVPTDRTRKITDLHIALQSQPGGMTLETKKFNAAGTSSSVVHTATLGANVTRISYNNLEISVLDKERVFWNVPIGGIVGSVAPNVLQCLLFGVIL